MARLLHEFEGWGGIGWRVKRVALCGPPLRLGLTDKWKVRKQRKRPRMAQMLKVAA